MWCVYSEQKKLWFLFGFLLKVFFFFWKDYFLFQECLNKSQISDEGSGRRNEAVTGAEAAPMGDELKLPSYLALPNRKRPAPADEQSDIARNI